MGIRIEEPDRLSRFINNRDSYSDEFKGLVLKLLAEGKSVEQAAGFAGVSPQAVYEWVREWNEKKKRAW